MPDARPELPKPTRDPATGLWRVVPRGAGGDEVR
jgi:hypothetical protein